jgi:hypothetical protein
VTGSPGNIGDDTTNGVDNHGRQIEKRHASELGFGDGYAWAQEIAHDDELTRLSQINLEDIDDGEEAAFAVLRTAVDPDNECTSQEICAACFGDAHSRLDHYWHSDSGRLTVVLQTLPIGRGAKSPRQWASPDIAGEECRLRIQRPPLEFLEHVDGEIVRFKLAIPVGPNAIHLIALDTEDGHQWSS